ncbi:MAG: amidohydrolase family protein [Thermoplasmata archaeon]
MDEAPPLSEPGALVVRNAMIYPSPDAAPIERGSIVIRDGRIAAIGSGLSTPPGTQELSGEGRVVVAGFWNSHVHFSEPKWKSAGRKPMATLNAQLQDMLTSRGFTTVADTGSDPRDTLILRVRIESKELLGPRIYTSGPGIFPPKGIPYYVRDEITFWVRWLLAQPSTPAAAVRYLEKNLARGSDFVKLFTGSYVARGRVTTMPEAIARAAVNAAHADSRLVFSHPSNLEGMRIAIASGVDVLAHPPDTAAGVDASVIQQIVARGMAMIPTLQMFADVSSSDMEYLAPIYEVVRQFQALGGQLLFGTDVGFMHDYATDGEFRALVRSGVDARGILRMLTVAPAQRFGMAHDVSTITEGARADLVLLDTDPMEDILSFARVRATIRSGRVLYLRP